MSQRQRPMCYMCETVRAKTSVEITPFVWSLNQGDDDLEHFLDEDVRVGDRIPLCRTCAGLWAILTSPPRSAVAKAHLLA